TMMISVARLVTPAPGAVQTHIENTAKTIILPHDQGLIFVWRTWFRPVGGNPVVGHVGESGGAGLGPSDRTPVMKRQMGPHIQTLVGRTIQLQERRRLALVRQRHGEAAHQRGGVGIDNRKEFEKRISLLLTAGERRLSSVCKCPRHPPLSRQDYQG